jgi:hypothetical protein
MKASSVSVCVPVCVSVSVCVFVVCVRMCVRATGGVNSGDRNMFSSLNRNEHSTHTYSSPVLSVNVWVCVCVCACGCKMCVGRRIP